MPNPLASPKSSDRDALRDLEQHPGWALIVARLTADLEKDREAFERAQGLQACGFTQGVAACRAGVLRLREQMITELNAELESFKDEGSVTARADKAFGYS